MVLELRARWRAEDDEVVEELRYGLEGGWTFIKVPSLTPGMIWTAFEKQGLDR